MKHEIAGIRQTKQTKYLGVTITNDTKIYIFWINRMLANKIFKAKLGKLFWKGFILATIMHGAEARLESF